MNNGAFDGELLNHKEKEIRAFYRKLLHFTLRSSALLGEYREIHSYNREHTGWYNDRIFSYTRWKGNERLIIVVNFDATHSFGLDLRLPPEMVITWGLVDGTYTLADQLTDRVEQLSVTSGQATTRINLDPLESLILKF
jgi:glycosidase